MNRVNLLSVILRLALTTILLAGGAIGQQRKAKPRRTKPPTTEDLPTTDVYVPPTPNIKLNTPSGDTFIIQTPNGDVQVRNFLINPVERHDYADMITITISETKDYGIVYQIFGPRLNNKYEFVVLPYTKPVESAVAKAEAALLENIGVSREDACKLNVRVGVADYVDPRYAGTNYGLSFCPSGNPFPISQTTNQRSIASEVSDPNNWTELNRGQKKGAFQFSQGRTLLYNGRPMLGVRFRPSVQKIAISPSAAGGKYAICVTFDDMESAAFLLRLDNHSGKQLALQGPPSVWAAWSPAGTHAVIGSYYEADETLYSINLPSGIVRRFSFKVSKQTEEESSDLDNLTWVDDRVFRVRVTVNCNPYTDDNCSDQDRKKVLREYEVRANVVTLAVSSERMR
jgi:hypothetical protein